MIFTKPRHNIKILSLLLIFSMMGTSLPTVYAAPSTSKLENEVSGLENELSELKADLKTLTKEISSIAGQITELNEEIQKTQSELATAKGNEETQYALEGSVFIGGAIIQWLRDEMRFFAESRDAEYYAQKVSDTGGVYVVPAFAGLGAPYWDMYARGTIVGITRAAQESIAYQSYDLVEAMEKDVDSPLKHLKVDGGASRDSFLMSFQADILGKEVVKPCIHETTALGVATLAGLTVGLWKDRAQIKALWQTEKAYVPTMSALEREFKLKKWRKAVERSRGWDLD